MTVVCAVYGGQLPNFVAMIENSVQKWNLLSLLALGKRTLALLAVGLGITLAVPEVAWAQQNAPGNKPAAPATPAAEPMQRNNKRIVQLSGLVVSGEDQVGVPGVNIYIPKAGRGTNTNLYGYFSLATMAGDSAIISAVGFRKQFYKVPDDGRQAISVIIYLKTDTLMMPEIEVFPYPTEELFKQAVLSLRLPEEELNNMRRNLDPAVINKIRYNTAMTGKENYRSYMSQEILRQETRYSQPTLQLVNPFAWYQFIKSVRRGDLKKKEYRQDD